jgi:mannosyltransferase OCH1-like enzyme
MIVHQVYGLFCDNKPMNELFVASSKAWKEYCDKNNYIYKLWNEKECNELVETYTKIKEYYYDVKYPVMKCDIIRFLIIYQFGGLYVDLDVIPNKFMIKIDESKLTFCKYMNKKEPLDIEMVYSPKYNNDLYNYLLYIPTQIREKNEIKIYDDWKIRYIFQTTGPASFRRYLKINNIKINIIKVCHLDEHDKYPYKLDKNKYGDYDYDCLSYFSVSYSPFKYKTFKYSNKKKVKISDVVENI